MLACDALVNILHLTRIFPAFHVLSDNSHKLHESHISQQYHSNIFWEQATTNLQLDLWLCHKQVGHERLVYFDQAIIDDCCVVPVTTFNKGTISIVVFNSTTSLNESCAWWDQMHTIGPNHKIDSRCKHDTTNMIIHLHRPLNNNSPQDKNSAVDQKWDTDFWFRPCRLFGIVVVHYFDINVLKKHGVCSIA